MHSGLPIGRSRHAAPNPGFHGDGRNGPHGAPLFAGAERAGRDVGPKELTVRLGGITSASMTSLVDRLVRSGYVTREPHPTDRRALILRPTPGSDQEVRSTLGDMHARMMEVADTLGAQESAVVVDFLRRMREAIDAVAT